MGIGRLLSKFSSHFRGIQLDANDSEANYKSPVPVHQSRSKVPGRVTSRPPPQTACDSALLTRASPTSVRQIAAVGWLAPYGYVERLF